MIPQILYEIVGQFCYARRHPAGPTSTLSQRTSIQQLWEENEKAFEQSGEVCMRRIEDFVAIQVGSSSSLSLCEVLNEPAARDYEFYQ